MLKLTDAQIQQIVAQAQRAAPNETWGIIGGKEGRALKVYPMTNVHATPVTRYAADPQELLRVVREIEEDKGWEIVAIYHSHPATVGFPSATDIAEAHYPDSIYILISLMNPERAVVRGYRIVDGQVTEITLEVEDDPSPRLRAGSLGEGKRGTARRANRSRPGRAVAALSKRRPRRGQTRRARR